MLWVGGSVVGLAAGLLVGEGGVGLGAEILFAAVVDHPPG